MSRFGRNLVETGERTFGFGTETLFQSFSNMETVKTLSVFFNELGSHEKSSALDMEDGVVIHAMTH